MFGFIMYRLRKIKLGHMFTFIVLSIIVSITTVSYFYLYTANKQALEEKLYSKAKSILDFANVLLENRNEKFFSGQTDEIPQVIQNDIFDKFTDISKGEVYFKEASIHPMNPKNKALPFEEEDIRYFQKYKDKKERAKEITIDGKSYFMLSRPIVAEEKCKMCHPKWEVGEIIAIENVKINLNNFLSDLKTNMITIATSWFFNIVLVMAVVLLFFHKEIALRIINLSKAMKRIASGNFNIKDILEKEHVKQENKNEIDKLFYNLYDMAHSIKPVIDHVVEQAENVAEKSSYGIERISENYERVNEQTSELKKIKNLTQQLSSNIKRLKETLLKIGKKSNGMIDDIKDTKNILNKNRNKAQITYQSLDETIHAIDELKKHSQDIDKTIEVISSIAEETNLIALNAAIEAARAGVHGRSFAVVADKVRELAEISQANANNITQIVQTMQNNIQTVIKNAYNTKDSFQIFLEGTKNISKHFEEMQKLLNETVQTIGKFESDFYSQLSTFKVIAEKIDITDQKGKVIEENSKRIKDIMQSITKESEKLKQLSEGFEIIHKNHS